MFLTRILIFLFVLSFTTSTFFVYSPASAHEKFSDDIHFTIANFGHIPYGSTMIGRLVIAQNTDLCSPDEQLKQLAAEDKNTPLFILGDRGNCKFTTKAHNAQLSGAALAIIEDRVGSNEGIIMANDGYGYLVDIPSIFISRDDGDKLKQLVGKNFADKDNAVYVSIKFDTQQRDRALLNLWLDLNDRHSYVLVRDFQEYFMQLKDFVDVALYYRVSPRCLSCEQQDCLSKYDWCIVPHEESLMRGRDIIMESLRQHFVMKKHPLKWWSYVDKFDRDCTIKKNFLECADTILKDLGVDASEIQQLAVKEAERALSVSSGLVLHQWVESASKGSVLFYPEVSINNVDYQGELYAPDIFEMLCNSLTNPPEACLDTQFEVDVIPIPKGSLLPTILLVIALLAIGFLVLAVVYRRVIRKEMQQEMTTQVNQMVSQYISFYDNKEQVAS